MVFPTLQSLLAESIILLLCVLICTHGFTCSSESRVLRSAGHKLQFRSLARLEDKLLVETKDIEVIQAH